MTTVFHVKPYGRFTETQSNPRRKALYRKNKDYYVLGGNFSNIANIGTPIRFKSERQPQYINIIFL